MHLVIESRPLGGPDSAGGPQITNEHYRSWPVWKRDG